MLDNMVARRRDDEDCLPGLLHHGHDPHLGRTGILRGGGFMRRIRFSINHHHHRSRRALTSDWVNLLKRLGDRNHRASLLHVSVHRDGRRRGYRRLRNRVSLGGDLWLSSRRRSNSGCLRHSEDLKEPAVRGRTGDTTTPCVIGPSRQTGTRPC